MSWRPEVGGGGDREILRAAAAQIWGSERWGSHRGWRSKATGGQPVALDGDMPEEQRKEAMRVRRVA
jgi:hypothetical protein